MLGKLKKKNCFLTRRFLGMMLWCWGKSYGWLTTFTLRLVQWKRSGRERGGEKREGKIELSLVWLKEVKGRKANGMIFPPNPLFYFLQKWKEHLKRNILTWGDMFAIHPNPRGLFIIWPKKNELPWFCWGDFCRD